MSSRVDGIRLCSLEGAFEDRDRPKGPLTVGGVGDVKCTHSKLFRKAFSGSYLREGTGSPKTLFHEIRSWGLGQDLHSENCMHLKMVLTSAEGFSIAKYVIFILIILETARL